MQLQILGSMYEIVQELDSTNQVLTRQVFELKEFEQQDPLA